ncbi:hypothetical protein AGMMS49991_10970 [Spirochaetia bacterium]|nr:hypothetical protein AGMMS49991_10970 [Spirochaetia bacterium]
MAAAIWRLKKNNRIQENTAPPRREIELIISTKASGVKYRSVKDCCTTSAPEDAVYKEENTSTWARIIALLPFVAE